jgi:prepilin-type N-terminal cleavage/methylation domain-containing protein
MKKEKGFTLIELLVVIAIIGILSSVVLASLNTARNKGADAAIKADLAGIRSSAEVLYDTLQNKYAATGASLTTCASTSGSILGDSNVQAALKHATTTSAQATAYETCFVTPAAYAIAVKYKSDGAKFWCIDSVGSSKEVTTVPTTTVCP